MPELSLFHSWLDQQPEIRTHVELNASGVSNECITSVKPLSRFLTRITFNLTNDKERYYAGLGISIRVIINHV